MRTVMVDCSGVADEAEFWRRYLNVVKPEGANYFGRNIAAFWDAVSAGGPGWPGEVELVFVNAKALVGINDGNLLRRLREIAGSSNNVSVSLHAVT